ncbi:MAG: coproporphyrinogen III oxidase family protein [Deltaproteobacteria bacterium]|nr:coproporphyrinogen III oxidase family protein [Deltaproteobacteria bacterium]
MYLIEPALNTMLRKKMSSVLAFDDPAGHPVPQHTANDLNEYLLYIHIPFCATLCPYCSFHRYEYEVSTCRNYFQALQQELRMYQQAGYDFAAVYVGGGTPTIEMELLLDTLALARDLFSIKEISVETNPDRLVPAELERLKAAGVNRLSVGIQSFDDSILKQIGRYEKYGSGRAIQEKLQQARGLFDTLNLDLIFNMPVQSEASLMADLDIIDRLLPDQVTFYPLMTAASVAATLQKSLGAIDYKKEKNFYFLILNRMKKNYTGSTAWCFSRKRAMIDEYIIHYDSYVGAGSGAFGYFNDRIYINTFSLDEYMDKIKRGTFPVGHVKQFSATEKKHYVLLMKLFGLSFDPAALKRPEDKELPRRLWLEFLLLKLSGSIHTHSGRFELTDRGKYYWVMAMREFFIAVDTMRDYCRTMIDHQSS